jgi:hypothetical protein
MLFPWDHAGDAGTSSSVAGVALGSVGPDSDKASIDHVEIRIRGSSVSAGSGRASSLLPSHMHTLGGVPESPIVLEQDLQFAEEDFAFNGEMTLFVCDALSLNHFCTVPANNPAVLSQLSDLNLVNLERNSFNFLEYVFLTYILSY